MIISYNQPYPPIRLDKGFRMRQYHCPYLLLGHRLFVPALIKAALVDLTRYPVHLHALIGRGEEVYYGFRKGHL